MIGLRLGIKNLFRLIGLQKHLFGGAAIWIFCIFLGGPLFSQQTVENDDVVIGAERLPFFLPLLEGKNVACVVNHTSIINGKHLIDTLLKHKVKITRIFTPEHGFRGDADAGEKVENTADKKTGIKIISLYGAHKQPTAEDLQDVDVMLFDLQDVGVRFFTYISTMHHVMQACAEETVPLIILDRPNPNGDRVDGPILDTAYQSFVGMHPIPVLHGLTVGELAKMINGEGWLQGKAQCALEVITMYNYTHKSRWFPTVKPSPNLPNALSIRLYPSLCFFEGTSISVGRGTELPFQIAGGPDSAYGTYKFTPHSIPGAAKKPMYENKTCFGINLSQEPINTPFSLKYLIDFYNLSHNKNSFFNNFFDKLAGGPALQRQIKLGRSEAEIKNSWSGDLFKYRHLRRKYRIYND